MIKGVGNEAAYYKLLKYDLGISGVVDVALHNESGTQQFCVISLKKTDHTLPWKALMSASAAVPGYLKWVIAVDEDIDPHDPDSFIWALCWRMQPDRDVQIIKGKAAQLDPSAVPPEEELKMRGYPPSTGILIDAADGDVAKFDMYDERGGRLPGRLHARAPEGRGDPVAGVARRWHQPGQQSLLVAVSHSRTRIH